jgi:mono/diheme cytochrome c family protein
MQRYGLGMVVWCTLLGMALAAEQRPTASPGATVSGTLPVFVRYCSACHGVHGRRDGPAAPALQPPPADLTRITQRHGGRFPVDELTAVIDGRTALPAHGSREMPVWGAYFGEMGRGSAAGEAIVHDVLRILIDYLQAIQQ